MAKLMSKADCLYRLEQQKTLLTIHQPYRKMTENSTSYCNIETRFGNLAGRLCSKKPQMLNTVHLTCYLCFSPPNSSTSCRKTRVGSLVLSVWKSRRVVTRLNFWRSSVRGERHGSRGFASNEITFNSGHSIAILSSLLLQNFGEKVIKVGGLHQSNFSEKACNDLGNRREGSSRISKMQKDTERTVSCWRPSKNNVGTLQKWPPINCRYFNVLLLCCTLMKMSSGPYCTLKKWHPPSKDSVVSL